MAKKRAAAKSDKTDENKKKSPLKEGTDFIIALAGAVLIALIIKAYVFDVYLIPSGSMETALHGRPDGGDRIFCSKLSYKFRQPERWEVAVFEFPYESARPLDIYNANESFRGQNFVKRVVGLPGESVAISRGDIWVRPQSGSAEYARMVKPDSVQRSMWQKVYNEDFSDLYAGELRSFWRISGGGKVSLDRGGPMLLDPDGDAVHMAYRPMVPAGFNREEMVEMPGVPDRYVLEQPVQFRCRTVLAEGEVCNHVFVKSIQAHNIQARCPACGKLQDETSAIFYHRRSGLAAVGQVAINPANAPQGEDVQPRQTEYHIVPDLRVVTNAVFMDENSVFTITLREDNRRVAALFTADGRIELMVNNEASTPQQRAIAPIRVGATHTLEFYVVDGTARVFVDSSTEPVLDMPIWNDKRSFPKNLPIASGAALSAQGGRMAVASIDIDRDIFYYSGWEFDKGEKFAAMSSQGEVFINSESFFPMGDHGPSSYDARSWGAVPLNLLRGPALLIWWPPERIQRIAAPN
ncbi:MAG: signal peptidase I [Planctomycetes bacterium]|nr:signal peptidase I [Planctomycetota bacterium]